MVEWHNYIKETPTKNGRYLVRLLTTEGEFISYRDYESYDFFTYGGEKVIQWATLNGQFIPKGYMQ